MQTSCGHPMAHQGRCLLCDEFVGNGYGMPFEYLLPTLRISPVHVEFVRQMNTRNMVNMKKLHLVLDLDHTLLHTVRTDVILESEQEHLKEVMASRDDVRAEKEFFPIDKYLTKLRPFLREFLREANTMFEMTIYTMGSRDYGQLVAKILDPAGSYFSNRLITQEDCSVKGRKSLDIVLAEKSNIIVVDDKREVWPNHAANVIPVTPYRYFSTQGNKGKEDNERALAAILERLRRIHETYFSLVSSAEEMKDVRVLLKQIRN